MKIIYRFILIVSLALLGMAAGTTFGGVYLVPKGSGMAGPVMALGYGLIGASIAIILAIILSIKLTQRPLGFAALICGVPTLVLVIFLTVRFVDKQSQINAKIRTHKNQPTTIAPKIDQPAPALKRP